MNRETRQKIFEYFEATNPHPETELVYGDNFQLLIAVLLSAQATDRSVNLATEDLFRDHGTPEKMLALGVEGVESYIRTIGLFRTKAKNVIKTCELLLEKHGGVVPATREELEALPGVGRKTANVVLNIAFGELTMAVDTHIFRVSNRTGIAPGKTPLAVEKGLLKHVPTQYLRNAHHWLILHGRYICVARKPRCEICGISQWCDDFRRKERAKIRKAERAAKAAAATQNKELNKND